MTGTAFTRQAGIEVPLICGAMYPCSNPELVAAVSEAAYAWPAMPVVIAAGAMVVLTTSVSGIDYTLIYIRRAVAVSRARAAAAR